MIPEIRIKYNGVNVRLVGIGLTPVFNLRILEAGIASIRARLAKGLDTSDGPSRPLKKRYARYKAKVLRRLARRDGTLTGNTLSTLKTRYADERRAIAEPSGRESRLAFRVNRDLFLFSERDQAAMSVVAEKLFKERVTQNFDPSIRFAARGRRTSFKRAA